MTPFEDFFSVEHLDGVVESILDGHFDVIRERPRVSTGADRIDLDLFLRDRDKHIAAISRKVLEGRFTFNPFMEREIPKADSRDMRTISISSIRDGIVQRALYHYAYESVDDRLSPAVFGYRRGKSAHDAVRQIRSNFNDGLTSVFDADLKRFFDTVNHDVLLDQVCTLGLDERAETLVRRFLKTGRVPSDQVEEHRTAKGKKRKFSPESRLLGVPQGGVLSGLLSNLYLADFDATVQTHHTGYIRYADDFLICCRSEEDCEAARELVEQTLLPLRVTLNPDKTRTCVSGERGVDFLGFRISTERVRVRRGNVKKFKDRIREVIENQEVKPTPEKTLRSLAWRLSFKIRGPNEAQLEKLEEHGQQVALGRRSWIGFFRIVDDLDQIRRLDRWIREQVSRFMWDKHACRVKLTDMQEYGMPSLVNTLFKARRRRRPDAGDE